MATENAVAAGVVVVVAAGNEACSSCRGSPNAASNAIVVGATDVDDFLAWFSNSGKVWKFTGMMPDATTR
jgi:cerevisin